MTPYRFPLITRELGIIKLALAATVALLSLGIALLYVTFDGPNRYRILAEPTMLRSLALPVGLLAGGAVAWLSFVREMKSGTWDGFLLLPYRRSRLALTKLGVGAGGLVVALALPTGALWLVLAASDRVGGPVISPYELALKSAFTQSALVAVTTYLAVGNVALLAREGYVTFPVPLLVPLAAAARFFAGGGGFQDFPESAVALAVAIATVPMAAAIVLAVIRAGAPSGSAEIALRALLLTPATMILAVVFSLISHRIAARLADAPRAVAPRSTERAVAVGVRLDGHIGPARREVPFYSPARAAVPEARLRTPLSSDRRWQLFWEASALTAFDAATGARLGCVGAEGLSPSGRCAPFDAPPELQPVGGATVVLTRSGVLALEADGRLRPLHEGRAVRASVRLRVDEDDALAVFVDDDLVLLRPDDHAVSDEEAGVSGPAAPLRVEVACRGLTDAAGHPSGVAVVSAPTSDASGAPRPFVAARFDRDDGSSALAVCRGGAVVEHQTTAPEPRARAAPVGFGRGEAVALSVGPAVDRVLWRWRHPEGLEPWPLRSLAAALVAGALTLVFAGALAWRRRGIAWWLLPGLALGPAYLFACALLSWRRSRFAALVR